MSKTDNNKKSNDEDKDKNKDKNENNNSNDNSKPTYYPDFKKDWSQVGKPECVQWLLNIGDNDDEKSKTFTEEALNKIHLTRLQAGIVTAHGFIQNAGTDATGRIPAASIFFPKLAFSTSIVEQWRSRISKEEEQKSNTNDKFTWDDDFDTFGFSTTFSNPFTTTGSNFPQPTQPFTRPTDYRCGGTYGSFSGNSKSFTTTSPFGNSNSQRMFTNNSNNNSYNPFSNSNSNSSNSHNSNSNSNSNTSNKRPRSPHVHGPTASSRSKVRIGNSNDEFKKVWDFVQNNLFSGVKPYTSKNGKTMYFWWNNGRPHASPTAPPGYTNDDNIFDPAFVQGLSRDEFFGYNLRGQPNNRSHSRVCTLRIYSISSVYVVCAFPCSFLGFACTRFLFSFLKHSVFLCNAVWERQGIVY